MRHLHHLLVVLFFLVDFHTTPLTVLGALDDLSHTTIASANRDRRNKKLIDSGHAGRGRNRQRRDTVEQKGSKAKQQQQQQAKKEEKCGTIKHTHLSVGHDPSTSMTISFTSTRCKENSKSSSSSSSPPPIGAVFIGLQPDQLVHLWTERREPQWYNATRPPKQGGGIYQSHYFHHVTVTDLEPDTKYYYRCVTIIQDDANEMKYVYEQGDRIRTRRRHLKQRYLVRGGKEEEDKEAHRFLTTSKKPTNYIPSFITAPELGQGTRRRHSGGASGGNAGGPIKFIIAGDLGRTKRTVQTLNHMETHQKSNSNLIILAGDIAYSEYRHEYWDAWFDLMDIYPIMSELPLQISPGNHDVDKSKWGSHEIFVAYEKRFHMPQIRSAVVQPYKDDIPLFAVPYPLEYDYGNAYYSFVYGTTHNIFLCSYCSFEPDSYQYEWLVHELEHVVDRTKTPWLTVTMHCPMYNTFLFHRRDVQLKQARIHLEPLFIAHRVNVVFAGHIHAYMRTHGVNNDKRNDTTGPVHIVVGDAGGKKANGPFFSATPEEWVAKRDATMYGYGTFEIVNQTHAKWDWFHTGKEKEYNQICKKKNEGCKNLSGKVTEDHVYIRNQLYL